MPEFVYILIAALEIPAIALILYGLRYLMKKGQMDLTERQWKLIESATKDAIYFAEEKAFQHKKAGKPSMTSAEKLELASSLIREILVRFKLKQYEGIIMPLVEAKLRQVFKKPE